MFAIGNMSLNEMEVTYARKGRKKKETDQVSETHGDLYPSMIFDLFCQSSQQSSYKPWNLYFQDWALLLRTSDILEQINISVIFISLSRELGSHDVYGMMKIILTIRFMSSWNSCFLLNARIFMFYLINKDYDQTNDLLFMCLVFTFRP